MAKIVVRDDCFAPEKYMYLTYNGPDPWRVASEIGKRIKPLFHVSSSGLNQDYLLWDATGEKTQFYAQWWIRKEFSTYTKMMVYLRMKGEKTKTTNVGNFWLELNPELDTRFEGWSVIIKPFWAMYSYLFYDRVRRQYLAKCRELSLAFRNELKEAFGLRQTTHGAVTSIG